MKKMKKRMTAIGLVMVMVCSLFMLPQSTVVAAETTLALDFDNTVQTKTANAQNNVEMNLGNAGITSLQDLQTNGVTTLCVTFKITKLTASGDAGVQAFINAEDCWEGTWKNVSASASEQTVSLDLTKFYDKSGELYNFGLQICNVTSVTYQITDAYLVKGEGGSTGGGNVVPGGSDIGTIDTSVDYNFAKLLQYSLYFYDGNMCGDGVNDKSLFSKTLYGGWRGNCHVQDSFTYNGKKYSAVGGYHDAGDHVKFGLPMAEAMSTLGIGYMEFGDAFVELKQDQHFRTILDYYCDYVKSCTVVNAKGEAEAFCYQVGHGQKDHESWCAPEVENESQTDRQYTLIATSSNPATDIVSETAAALAINYLNFGKQSDLDYAKKLFAFATKNTKKNANGDDSGTFYGAGSWEDDYCLAAAMLYKATKDDTYKTAYNQNNKNSGNIQKPYGWADVYQAAAFYAPEKNNSEINTIQSWMNGIVNQNSNRYYCADSWGSARYNCNVQLMMLIASNQQGGNATYEDWAKYQMSIILGNNSLHKNLVVGYNNQSPKQPHHRAASGQNGWSDFRNASVVSKYTLYGALVGGPTTSDFSTYKDEMDNDHTSEVTLDYNAGLVGAAAALYLLNKDSVEDGFDHQTINATFYGGKEFTDKIGGSTQTEEKTTEKKTTEKPTTEKPTTEKTTTEEKTTEGKTSEVKTTEGKTSEEKTTEEKTSEVKTTEGKTSEEKITEEKTSEVKTTEGKTSEEKTTEGKITEEQESTEQDGKADADGQDVNPVAPDANISKDNNGEETNEKPEVKVENTEAKGEQTEEKTQSTVEASELLVYAVVKNVGAQLVGKSYKLAPKKKMKLSVTFMPENAIPQTLQYSSSNEKIATVDQNGVVTAGKKAGTTVITVKSEKGVEKSFTVKVMKNAVKKIKFKSTKKTLKKGKTLKLHVVISTKNASKNVVWKSSNTKIATVSTKGKVKALKKGKVKITAIATDGSGKKASVKLSVK